MLPTKKISLYYLRLYFDLMLLITVVLLFKTNSDNMTSKNFRILIEIFNFIYVIEFYSVVSHLISFCKVVSFIMIQFDILYQE